MITRCGIGYDIHRVSSKRKLWLGGIEIPSDFGLEGHSDADVLLHAISDALLGAAALGDIGKHFQNTDPQWKDVQSSVLLRKVYEMLTEKSYMIVNIDATIIMEYPKISPFTGQMSKIIADTLGIESSQVNIKATTNEGLGALGREEGIAAIAIATVQVR